MVDFCNGRRKTLGLVYTQGGRGFVPLVCTDIIWRIWDKKAGFLICLLCVSCREGRCYYYYHHTVVIFGNKRVISFCAVVLVGGGGVAYWDRFRLFFAGWPKGKKKKETGVLFCAQQDSRGIWHGVYEYRIEL